MWKTLLTFECRWRDAVTEISNVLRWNITCWIVEKIMHQGHLSLISMLTLLHGFLNEFPAQKRKENKTLLLWRNISKRMVNNVYQWQIIFKTSMGKLTQCLVSAKWPNKLQQSYNIYCKIFNVCLTILKTPCIIRLNDEV